MGNIRKLSEGEIVLEPQSSVLTEEGSILKPQFHFDGDEDEEKFDEEDEEENEKDEEKLEASFDYILEQFNNLSDDAESYQSFFKEHKQVPKKEILRRFYQRISDAHGLSLTFLNVAFNSFVDTFEDTQEMVSFMIESYELNCKTSESGWPEPIFQDIYRPCSRALVDRVKNHNLAGHFFNELIDKECPAINFFGILFDFLSDVQAVKSRIYRDNHRYPVKLTASFNASEILSVMPEQYVQELIETWPEYNDGKYLFEGLFEVLLGYQNTYAILFAELKDILIPDVIKIIGEYYIAQQRYDQILLSCSSSGNNVCYKFFRVARSELDKLLPNLSTDELIKNLKSGPFRALLLKHKDTGFYHYILDHLKKVIPAYRASNLYIEIWSPELIVEELTQNQALRNFTKGNHEDFCRVVNSLMKNCDGELKDIQLDKENVYFKRAQKDGSPHNILKNTFLCLFSELKGADRIINFLQSIDLKTLMPTPFMAILEAIKIRPADHPALLQCIFKKLTDQEIVDKLAGVPFEKICDLFSIWKAQPQSDAKDAKSEDQKENTHHQSSLNELNHYIFNVRRKSPLRTIQAFRAKVALTHFDEKNDPEYLNTRNTLYNLVARTQADHDRGPFRFFGTSSRLANVFMHAATTLDPAPIAPPVTRADKIRMFFMTNNDKINRFLQDRQPPPAAPRL